MTDSWNRLLDEARRCFAKDEVDEVRWDRVDAGLFSRIEKMRVVERRSLSPARIRPWAALAAVLAAGAATAFVAVNGGERRPLEVQMAPAIDDAGSVLAIAGSGQLLIGGRSVRVGAALKLGDEVETRGVQATVGRTGKVELVVERGSMATVTHVQGVLVLALARGAIEAEVAPVASGEAFAIDVGPSRVAVHGTHFRVARRGEEVVVDLSEGVVSVGAAPRTGSTWGGLVTAPAHAEFLAADARSTLRISHDAAAMRQPETASVAPPVETKGGSGPTRAGRSAEPAIATPGTAAARTEARLLVADASGMVAAEANSDRDAEGTLAAAVRACVTEQLPPDDITVVVSTTLTLLLDEEGAVRTARFDPPVAPDINHCAAQAIYRAHFAHGGEVTIPVTVKN